MKQCILKLSTIEGEKISRSQAREILRDASTFSQVILDFDQVSVVGQAFVDEIYRVFQERHPDIRLENENMNEGVTFVVERAKNEAKNRK